MDLWTHEPAGKPDAFCGRSYKHELRDLRAALWRIEAAAASWDLDLKGSAWTADEASRVEACLRDVRAALAGTVRGRWNLCWSCGHHRKQTRCARLEIDDPSVATCDGYARLHDVETFPDPKCPCELCTDGRGRRRVIAAGAPARRLAR